MSDQLLTLPANIGRLIAESARLMVCPLLATSKFVEYCRKRGIQIDRERLLRFERLGVFAPLFRVLTPSDEDAQRFAIPIRDGNNWFEKGWAWDTTAVPMNHAIPNDLDGSQEAYYSAFQVGCLSFVVSCMTMNVQLEGLVAIDSGDDSKMRARDKRWHRHAKFMATMLGDSQFRRARAALCQYVSNRYYPNTRTDMRTRSVSGGVESWDTWTTISSSGWRWRDEIARWDPKCVEEIFSLTPQNLRHAYESLAVEQACLDPIENWYSLVQFVSLAKRDCLKGDALLAHSLREGAMMLRLLYKDLYREDLRHPNEISRTVMMPVPENEVRADVRRYLEFVVNDFGLNPQHKLMLMVEGESEARVIVRLFHECFGFHPGVCGIGILSLHGVGNATGTRKEDRSRAIVRLLDHLHHQQTIAYILLDCENDAVRLKAELAKANSIHGIRACVTRDDYVQIWRSSFEFDNWSDAEIADALSAIGGAMFGADEVAMCRQGRQPASELRRLYSSKTGVALIPKLQMMDALVDTMLKTGALPPVEERPIFEVIRKVVNLAVRNPFPVTDEIWRKNQKSDFLASRKQP